MGAQILAVKVAAAVFLLVCVAHVLRVIFGVKVVIGSLVLPLWLSVVAAAVTLSLAVWLLIAAR